jgi:hypothetical protein
VLSTIGNFTTSEDILKAILDTMKTLCLGDYNHIKGILADENFTNLINGLNDNEKVF